MLAVRSERVQLNLHYVCPVAFHAGILRAWGDAAMSVRGQLCDSERNAIENVAAYARIHWAVGTFDSKNGRFQLADV